MGGFTQAITQGIGRAGSEYGQAKEYLRQTKQQDVFTRLQALQSAIGLMRLQRELQQSKLPQYHGVFTDERGNVHAITTDPATGEPGQKLLYQSGAKYPDFRTMQEMESWALTHGDEDLLKKATAQIKATQRASETPHKSFQTLLGPDRRWHRYEIDEITGEKKDLGITHVSEGRAGEERLPPARLQALAKMWEEQGQIPPGKDRGQVEQYMIDHNMQVKTKLTGQEQQLSDTIKQIEPKIAQLKKIIEDNHLEGENSFVFGHHSALAQWMRFHGVYGMGVKPEKVSADLIKAAAFLRVAPAAMWARIGRSKYTYEVIAQHLPRESDTPAQLYDKVQFLEGITEEARNSLPQTEDDMNDLKSLGNVDKLVHK